MTTVWRECVGALHVHTLYSDGARSIENVVEAAQCAGLDFLVIADHDTLAGRREGWEGRRGSVDVLVAAEITPRAEGHMLAMRVNECAGYAASPNYQTLDAIRDQGGYAIVAHPTGKDRRWLGIYHEPWYDWHHPCIRGMEIWSYTHDWVDAIRWWRFPCAHMFSNHPERVVRGPERRVLRMWDHFGRSRRFSGVGGLDLHARRVPIMDVVIFPYERMFHYLRNHFYIDADTPPAARTAALWDALAEGRGFVAHDILADAKGAECAATLPGGERMMMGEERPFAKGLSMTLTLPVRAQISWIANGRPRLRVTGDSLTAEPIEPGVYRFEARLDGRPWLFTNPFYLR